MKPAKSRPTDHSGRITAGNYVERAMAFVEASPEKQGFVIRSVEGEKGEAMTEHPATDAQWIAWAQYLSRLGYFNRLNSRGKPITTRFMFDHGEATVPAEWPELFDPDAPTSAREAVLHRSPILSEAHRAQMRMRVKGEFKRLLANWKIIPASSKPGYEVETKSPTKPTLDELAADSRAHPPAPLDAAALAIFGRDAPPC